MPEHTFFVVVPLFNEEKLIAATLTSVAAQTDHDFAVVVVDNGSTDRSRDAIAAFQAAHPAMAIYVLDEPQKGTGAAVDSGFRYAIAQGAAYIARTDADCLPRRDWIQNIKRAFALYDLEFVIGKIKARSDDTPLTLRDRLLLPGFVFAAENAGKFLRRGPQFKYRYIMVAGNNLAITADLYERAGGFPRTRIEDVHEDKILSERIRCLTNRVRKCNDVIVYNSIRRARRYGYWNTLMWYWDHKFRPSEVDVR